MGVSENQAQGGLMIGLHYSVLPVTKKANISFRCRKKFLSIERHGDRAFA